MSKKKVLFLIFIPLSLAVIYIGVNIFSSYKQIRDLPFVTDPEQFAKDFSTEGQNEANLTYRCNQLKDFLCKNMYAVSPFIPYTKLDTSHHISYLPGLNYQPERLSIRIDHLWKVFWIDTGSTGIFGPYRSKFTTSTRETLDVAVEKELVKEYEDPRVTIATEVGENYLRLKPHLRDTFAKSEIQVTAYRIGDKIVVYEDEILDSSQYGYTHNRITESIDTTSIPSGTYELIFEKRDIYENKLVISWIVVRKEIELK